MEQTKIYLEFSSEIEEVLIANGGIEACLKEAFNQENIEAEIEEDEVNYQNEQGVRDKDIVTIVLAGTAAFAGISISIAHLITSLKGTSTFVVYNELEEVKDNDGKVILNKKGKPIMKKVKKFIKKDPKKDAVEKSFEVGFSWKNGLVIKYSNSEKDNK